MTFTKTEAQKEDKKLYDVEVTELDKFSKGRKIHFEDYSTQFDKWRYFGGYEGLDHKPLLSDAISRTEFVTNIGKLHTELKEFPVDFNSGAAFIIRKRASEILPQIRREVF